MAIFMGNQVTVVLAGTTISDHVSSITLTREVDAVEITAMNDQDHVFLKGLRNDSVTMELFQDFAATSVNSLIDDVIGTYVNLKLVPVTGTVSSTNPSYTMSCFINSWTPIASDTASPMTASITWPVKNMTKATT